MANRVFRLSISPEDAPEVLRVIDFDGRASLADVHAQIAELYGLDDSDHFYGFFTSGRFWDADSAYFDPRTHGRAADRALLFRLKLSPQQQLAYLLDFGAELRYIATVVGVSEVSLPLAEPRLIEAVGEAPAPTPLDTGVDDELPEEDPPDLAPLVALAEAFLDIDDGFDDLDAEAAVDPVVTGPTLRAAAQAGLALLTGVNGDRALFLELAEWLLKRSLTERLLALPLQLAHVAEFELGVSLARGLAFVDRELAEGDLAVVLAKASRREEALAQLASNLDKAEDRVLVEAKAGDVHRALGDLPAAEAYYRRSLTEAKEDSERLQAMVRVASVLVDQDRGAEANEVLQAARALELKTYAEDDPLPVVGRNDPCPCGSGKKYKKCHG